MKKYIFLVILFSSLGFCLGAESLRNYVCCVRADENDENIQFLRSLGKDKDFCKLYSRNSGLRIFFQNLNANGFVVRAQNGKKYVLTVERAVKNSRTANVSFLQEDNSVLPLTNLPVFKSDENTGLSLVALPADFDCQVLDFFEGKAEEGENVYTASVFPNQKTPDYFFQVGFLQNPFAPNVLNDFSKITFLYLHSLPANSLSDGQPLLVKSGTSYKILGVNIKNDEESYAIPGKFIKEFLEQAFKDDSESQSATTKNQSYKAPEEFFATLKNPQASFTDISEFISDEFVRNYGKRILFTYHNKIDKKTNKFKSFGKDPMDCLRATCAFALWAELKGGTPNAKNPDEFVSWKSFDGALKICDAKFSKNFRTSPKEESKQNESYFGFGYDSYNDAVFRLEGGLVRPTEDGTNGFDANLGFDIFCIGAGLFFEREKVDLPVKSSERGTWMNSFGISARLLLPFYVWRLSFTPFVEGRLGLSNITDIFGGDTTRLYFADRVGLELMPRFFEHINPFISVSGLHSTYNAKHTYNVEFSAGIKFCLATGGF